MQAAEISCPRCGTKVDSDDIFCGYCHLQLPESIGGLDAAPLDDAELPAAPVAARRRRPMLILTGVLAIASLAVAAFAVAHRRNDTKEIFEPSRPVLRQDPLQIWEHDIDAEVLALTSDNEFVYLMTNDVGRFTLQSFAGDSGDERWRTEFDLSSLYDFSIEGLATAQLRVTDAGLSMLYGAGSSIQRFVLLDPQNGEVQWTDQTTMAFPFLGEGNVVEGVIFDSPDVAESARVVQRIDVGNHRLDDLIRDVYLTDRDGRVFVDRDGVLSLAGDTNGSFRFVHEHPIQTVAPLSDGTFVAAVEERPLDPSEIGTVLGADRPTEPIRQPSPILRGLDAQGQLNWSFDPGVGPIAHVQEMSDDRLVVQGLSGMRVISVDPSPRLLSGVRSYQAVTVGPGSDDRDLLFATQGMSSRGDTTVSVLDLADGDFRKIADIAGYPRPDVTPNGDVAYLSTYTDDFELQQSTETLAAIEISTGQTIWRMELGSALVTWTESGFATVTAGDTATIVGYG